MLVDGELFWKIRGVIKIYVYSVVGEKGKNMGFFLFRFLIIYFGVYLILIFFLNLYKINNLYLNMGILIDSMFGFGEWWLGFFIYMFGYFF